MTYILYKSDHTIKGFMDYIADVPLAPGESFATSPLMFEQYAELFVLSHNGQTCCAVEAHVGDDPVLIDVSAPGQSSIQLSVGNDIQTVHLTDGKGTLTLATDRAARIPITAADRTTFCPAGEGSLLVIIEDNAAR
jgi:hypothetical protein